MFDSHLFAYSNSASRIVLLMSIALATASVAEATTPSDNGWHAKGAATVAESASVADSSAAPQWRLPNQRSAAPAASVTPPSRNPLRQKPKVAATPPREPRRFQAPTDATRLTTAPPPPATKTAALLQQHLPSAAVAQTSAVVPRNKKPTTTVSTPRPVVTRRQTTPHVARAPRSSLRSGPNANPYKSPTWQRFNVAMQGPDGLGGEGALGGDVEDLPLPGVGSHPGATKPDPFGPGNGYYLEGDGQYDSCGPDGCGDACGCGDGVCEPGCGCGCGDACEPGCDCPDGECCNDCLSIGPGDPESCHSVRIRVPKWQEFMIFAGVQGFKGPYDLDRDSGNFGFHEGFNASYKIPYTFAGYQIGYQAVQSQLNGDKDTDIEESHTQHFTTFGLFRRVDDGLQFGTAWDVLVDQRNRAYTFHQLRGELSWMDCGCHEFGLSATVGTNDHEDRDDDDFSWQASDQYLLFYRFHGRRGGEGRFYAGFNDDSDGIIGSDMLLPVHDRWSVQTGFTYLIPDARDGEEGAAEEAWNIAINMVWHWDCRARKAHDNPYRPLFNVADNGYMIVDRREDSN